ncbi:MAG: hypothetical protein AAF725_13175, partial [Acidobacteriota bacterium]
MERKFKRSAVWREFKTHGDMKRELILDSMRSSCECNPSLGRELPNGRKDGPRGASCSIKSRQSRDVTGEQKWRSVMIEQGARAMLKVLLERLTVASWRRATVALLALAFSFSPAYAEQEAHSAFWFVDPTTRSVLEVASNSYEVRKVTPVLRIFGADPIRLPSARIPPGEVHRWRIGDFVPAQVAVASRMRTPRHAKVFWGSATIESEKLSGLTSWIVTSNSSEKWGL